MFDQIKKMEMRKSLNKLSKPLLIDKIIDLSEQLIFLQKIKRQYFEDLKTLRMDLLNIIEK